jgi:hypothetical protein
MPSKNRGIRTYDRATWERVGLAIQEYVGNDYIHDVQELCVKYRVNYSLFTNYFNQYRGFRNGSFDIGAELKRIKRHG